MNSSYFTIPNFSHMGFGAFVDTYPFNQLTLEEGIFASILVLFGMISVFFGYRLFRITLFMATTYFVYTIIYPIIIHAGETNPEIVFGVSVGIALICGLVAFFYWKLGLFVAGCLIGHVISIYILGFAQSTVIGRPPWSYVFIAVCCLVFGILILFFKKPLLIISTACLGSYFVFYGLDVFMLGKTGFATVFDGFISGTHSITQMTDDTWYMVAGSVVLAILGILVQFLLTGKVNVFDSKSKSSSTTPKSSKGKDLEDGQGVSLQELQSRIASRKK
jgi:hypothetical protein